MNPVPDLSADELRKVQAGPWFAGLSCELRQAILDVAQPRSASHGERLFSQGEAPWRWLCVVRGSVRLSQSAASGHYVVTAFIRPGDWIGEVELADGKPMTHDAYAQGATRLISVGRSDFERLCKASPEFVQALLRLQCARLRVLFEQLADLHALTLEQRLAKQLLRLERAFGVDGPCGSPIALRVLQSDLGGLIGASRQRVNGVLRRFQREGAVRLSPAGVQIVEHERLRASCRRRG
jgi:CRP/FNR family cyclic AMP-dependent transcriptional regulator